jgi:Yip1 domain
MASIQDRVIGALRLQVSTFEEVEHDATATSQAAIVVLVAAISGAIGASRGVYFGAVAIVMSVVFSLIGWAVGAAVIWLVGTRVFPGKNTEADYGQLLRCVGFAQAPGLFGILGIIPILGLLIRVVLGIWSLIAGVIAVRQALDYDDTLKAVIVVVVAWVIMFLITMLVGVLGLGAAAVGGGMIGG